MKSSVKILETLKVTSGKLHKWVKAEVIKPKKGYKRGDIITIRKPN